AFARELARSPGVVLPSSPDLEAALAGQFDSAADSAPPATGDSSGPKTSTETSTESNPTSNTDPSPADALDRAAEAHGRSDCAAVETAGAQAIMGLAARQAAADRAGGTDATIATQLTRAYALLLLCAHAAGDADRAMQVRKQLEQLGVGSAPAGVDAEIWDRYPIIDATTNTQIVELTVTTEPAGGIVWFNHRKIGPAPATVLASEGEHLFAAATPSGNAARAAGAIRVAVKSPAGYGRTAQPVTIPLAAAPSAPATDTPAGSDAAHLADSLLQETNDQIILWRGQAHTVAGARLGQLMTGLGVRVAVLLTDAGQAEMWTLGPGERQARRHAADAIGNVAALASKIRTRTRRWELTGPDPNTELLRETSVTIRDRSQRSKRQPWWVYATILGAVAIGGAVILSRDLADDDQRIEVNWP
ncbi:MAG: hypothetical protein AAGC55_26865, partial [Myxococcota bacterium]